MRNIDIPKQERWRSQLSQIVNLLFLFGSPRAFTTLLRIYLLSPSRDSNDNLFQRHSHSNGLPATWNHLPQLNCCIVLTITQYI
jgi:hypothetical protein